MKKQITLWFSLLLFSAAGFGANTANPDSIIWAQVVESDVHRRAGEFQDAIDILVGLIKTYENAPEVADTSMAWVYHKLGWNYYWTDEFSKAIDFTTKAIEIRKKSLGNLHPDLANSRFNRGAIHLFIGNLDEAEANFLAAIRGIEQTPFLSPVITDSILAYYYFAIGGVEEQKGDYFKAFPFWDKALNYYQKKKGDNQHQIGYLYDRQGVAFKNLGAFENALAAFQKALESYEISTKSDAEDLAVTCNGIGFTYAKMGAFSKARDYFEKSIDYFIASKDLVSLPTVYANLVWAYTEEKAFREAELAFVSGMNYVKGAADAKVGTKAGVLLRRKAELELAKGNINESLGYYQQAIKAFVPDFVYQKISDHPFVGQGAVVPNKNLLLEVLASRGAAFYQKFKASQQTTDLEETLHNYALCDTLIISIRQAQQSAESKYILNRQVIGIYEKGLAVALELFERTAKEGYLHQAYQLATRNKSIILLEAIKDENAKQFAGVPDSLLQIETNLNQKYYQAERNLFNLIGKEQDSTIQNAKNNLFQLRRNYEDLVEQLETEYPNYYELKYGPMQPLQPDELIRQLDDNSVILEYFVGTKTIYTFLLSKEGINYFELSKPQDFDEVCHKYRQALVSNNLTSAQKEALYQSSYQLYQWLLIEPLSDLPATVNHLIIVPDDILLQISFDALLYQKPSTPISSSSLPFLFDLYSMSYAYSNRLIFDRQKNEKVKKARKGFAGFGLEYDTYTLDGLNALDTMGNNRSLALARRSMGKLIYSDDEVREIASLLNGKTWLNREATKMNFLENARHYGILHLAMHSIVDENRPLNSAMIFTRQPDSEDYFLYASEIYGLELPETEMVVLSACNTGYGQLRKGEGIRNLSRAFAYAGSPSLVASLWSAPDKSTKEIMVTFYKYLQKGWTKDKALRQAKLDYLDNTNPEYAAPYYWAHLIVAGENSNIIIERKSVSSYLIFGLLGLVLLVVIGKKIISKTR